MESKQLSIKADDGLSISVDGKHYLDIRVVGPHLGKTIEGPWEIEGTRATWESDGFKAYLSFSFDEELCCRASIVSDSDSLIGLLIPQKKDPVKVQARPIILTRDGEALWPEKFFESGGGIYHIPENAEFEAAFYPFPNPLEGTLSFNEMQLTLRSHSEEACFYCDTKNLGVIAAFDPWHPNLTASSVELLIKKEL